MMTWKGMAPAVAAALAMAGAAAGQVSPNAAPLGERTGPNAQPAPTPPFATPTPAPHAPPPPQVDASVPGSTLLLSDVRVHQGAARFPARPNRRWRPLADAGAGLTLDHRPGEILDAAWVRRQFTDNRLIGVETTPDRLVGLILLINQAYVQNGYVNSGLLLPQQGWPAPGAVLDLELVAGRVVPVAAGDKAIAVAWLNKRSRGLTAAYVRARMPSASHWPLNASEVERDFRLLADDPAIRTVNAQLVPGAHAGEATLKLTVDPQPRFDLYASYANSRSPSVGGERAAVGGSVRNALIAGDVLGGEYGDTSGLTDASLAYSAPILGPGTLLEVRTAYDDAAVIDESLRALDIRSKESSLEVGLSDKLIDTPLTPNGSGAGWIPARSLTVGLHGEYRESTSTLLGQPFSLSPGATNGRTQLDVLRGTINWVERGERQVIAASTTVSVGLDGTASDVRGVPSPDPHFTTVLVQLNYARRLGAGGLEFRARGAGQWASGLLYSDERFSVGGQESVRGYRENLLLADEGVLGSLEFSCPVGAAPGLCNGRSDDWRTVRVSVFTDGALVRNAIAPQPTPSAIASVGFSVEWAPSSVFDARLIAARALTPTPLLGPADLQDRGIAFEIIVHPLGLFGHRHG